MPTTLPRHMITETDDVAAALDRAAQRWPNLPKAHLCKNVLLDWADSFGDGSHGARRRRDVRRALIGKLPGNPYEYSRADEWPD